MARITQLYNDRDITESFDSTFFMFGLKRKAESNKLVFIKDKMPIFAVRKLSTFMTCFVILTDHFLHFVLTFIGLYKPNAS